MGEVCGLRLTLLGGFRLAGTDGEVRAGLPTSAERVLALIALRAGHDPTRGHVAGCIWPDTGEVQAAANLRSTLWRIRRVDPRVVQSDGQHLRVGPEVDVDVHHLQAVASHIRHHVPGASLPEVDGAMLARELLPGYFDDWLVFERERLRQVALSTLDRLVDLQIADGRASEAVLTALAAVESDPLRESAALALIRAHLACGNPSEAIRHADGYRELLSRELGIDPSPRFDLQLSELRRGPLIASPVG
jgi:DNA-binding SARP family transcriptional activator